MNAQAIARENALNPSGKSSLTDEQALVPDSTLFAICRTQRIQVGGYDFNESYLKVRIAR